MDATRREAYPFVVQPEGDQWFIFFPDLPGVMTQAESWEEIGTMAEDALSIWLDHQREYDRPIPEPRFEMDPNWDYSTVGDDMITTAGMAERLGVSQRRVLQIAERRGLGNRYGRSVLFRPDEVDLMKPGPVGRPKVS